MFTSIKDFKKSLNENINKRIVIEPINLKQFINWYCTLDFNTDFSDNDLEEFLEQTTIDKQVILDNLNEIIEIDEEKEFNQYTITVSFNSHAFQVGSIGSIKSDLDKRINENKMVLENHSEELNIGDIGVDYNDNLCEVVDIVKNDDKDLLKDLKENNLLDTLGSSKLWYKVKAIDYKGSIDTDDILYYPVTPNYTYYYFLSLYEKQPK